MGGNDNDVTTFQFSQQHITTIEQVFLKALSPMTVPCGNYRMQLGMLSNFPNTSLCIQAELNTIGYLLPSLLGRDAGVELP